ncbi:MAG: methylmalonyl-CoA epimerase [Cytophagaceae bacterium]
MLKVEHIAIAVKNMETSNALFSKLLGTAPYKEEIVESENVKTSFFKSGETKIELIAGLTGDDAISKFIEKKGEGMHHIAYAVEDIFQEIKRLKKEGFTFVSEEPKKGADNKLICFLHPKSTNGVLIELCQEIR